MRFTQTIKTTVTEGVNISNLVAAVEVEISEYWTSIRQCHYAAVSNLAAVAGEVETIKK